MQIVAIETRGLRCPWPALRAARALREHPGAIIAVRADDPQATAELAALAAAHDLTWSVEDDGIAVTVQLAPKRR